MTGITGLNKNCDCELSEVLIAQRHDVIHDHNLPTAFYKLLLPVDYTCMAEWRVGAYCNDSYHKMMRQVIDDEPDDR